jgi:serine/threonine protein kinase
MGIVYEAEQISMNRRVAVKVPPLALQRDQLLLQAFMEEARVTATFHHENIVPAYAVGCERGVHYIAMRFIDGPSLNNFITEPPTTDSTFRLLTQLFVQVANSLEHAHELGVIHRDIEPGNLLVDEAGKLWVIDWGLAQSTDHKPLKLMGAPWGILRFMSPELALKEGPVDQLADIYSLGAVLYELLTAKPAISGATQEETLHAIASKEPESPRSLNQRIPPVLEKIVLKAMAKDPAQRYQTATDMAAALRQFLS